MSIARHALVISCIALAAAPAGAEPEAAPPVRTVVTRAFFRELARDRAALDAVVDRAAGVVFIDHFTGAAGGPSGPPPRLLCGRALERRLRIVQRWMADGARAETGDGGPFCHNRPGPPTCTIGLSMEYDPGIHFQFRVDPARGVVLRAITLDDEVLVDAAEIGREHRDQARIVERLGATSCPTP